jgi:hypothetical protein
MARQHGNRPVLPAGHRSGGTSRPCRRGWGRFSGASVPPLCGGAGGHGGAAAHASSLGPRRSPTAPGARKDMSSQPLPPQIAGHGPVPAAIARELLATTAGRKTFRRLITHDGIVIGGDSRRRTFDGALETFIRARDGNRCTAPYCDAPIRHIDHVRRWTDGGRTEFANGRGLCEFHNHAREPLHVERRVRERPHGAHSWRGLDRGPRRGRTCARSRPPVSSAAPTPQATARPPCSGP